MTKSTKRWILCLAISVIIPFFGCANSPRLEFESMPRDPKTDESRTTFAQLAASWTDYDIHFSGTGDNPALAKGVLFDPKADDKMLIPEGDEWIKVENEETLQRLMKWIADPMSFNGRLMRILSPNDQFFGYLYLNIQNNFAGLRVVDENTIAVFPVRYADGLPIYKGWR